MKQFRLTMLHWTDPLGPVAGGIDSFVQGLIRFAPADVALDIVGVTSDPSARPSGRWLTAQLGEKRFRLFPVFAVRDAWRRSQCPLALRFTAAVRANRARFVGDMFLAHTVEPVLALDRTRKCAVVSHLNPDEAFAGTSSWRWRRFPRLYRAVERIALANVSQLYVVRESARDRYLALELDAPVISIPTGIDTSIFKLPTAGERRDARHQLRSELGLTDDAVICVAVGRLELQKDFALLLAAARLAKQVHLVLIGDGPERANLERQIAQTDLSSRAFLLGALTAKQIAAAHHASDFYGMSSSYEGMSIALLEAQACGLPAIAADVGEARRTIENGRTGIIVRSRTPLDFAHAMSDLATQQWKFRSHECAAAVAQLSERNVAAALYPHLLRRSAQHSLERRP